MQALTKIEEAIKEIVDRETKACDTKDINELLSRKCTKSSLEWLYIIKNYQL